MMIVLFFNDTATTEIYTLSLHDALPICGPASTTPSGPRGTPSTWCASTPATRCRCERLRRHRARRRSEEHTSELQSRPYLVCRLLLEKKKKSIDESVACGSCGVSLRAAT